jgi:hypothetical protein
MWNKKRWNLAVEIKLVRSDGRFIGAEWGKGMYNATKGFVYIKRPKMRKKYEMKVFDVRRYLQGGNILTVIMLGADEMRPVLADSFTKHVVEYEDAQGKVKQVRESVMNIKIDSGDTKAWKTAFQAMAKKTYSIASFMQQFQTPIAIAIVLIACFVGFTVLWIKMGSVCGK